MEDSILRFNGLKKLLLIMALAALAASINADVPNIINYQGRLTDDAGQPISGTKLIKFTIYGSDTGDDSLWSSGFQTVQIDDGLFKYELGSNVTLPEDLFAGNSPRYLGITVDVGTEMQPRTQFITAPYAYHALKADTSDWALGGSGAGAWVDDGSVVRLQTSNDRVGIGTSTANERLVVGKDLGGYGLKYIVSGSLYLDDVCGYKMGYNSDNHTTLQWDGDGAPFAIHTRESGVNYNHTLVLNSGNVGIGTESPSEILTVGDDIEYFSGNMITVGKDDPTSYAGISFGQDADNRGWMVYDNEDDLIYWGTKENGIFSPNAMYFKNGNIGIGTVPPDTVSLSIQDTYNLSGSESGLGVKSYIVNGSSEGWIVGGYFYASGGYRTTAIKCEAHDASDQTCYAGAFLSDDVGIRAEGADYGGWFWGDVFVGGILSKASGAFKIDHPLDPANKYLQHSFVESPDMMNVYNGNITTDNNGDAEVVLPEYFESLNKDFRYQLTVIGTFAQAIIAEKIQNGRFTIKTDKPNVEVSWQVTGIRQDPWANEHRIQVEVDKNDDEKGFYIAPELYGFGKDKRIGPEYHESQRNREMSK